MRRPASAQRRAEPAGLLHALRRETRDLHARLERHRMFRPLAAGTITPQAYGCLLQWLLPFHHQLDRDLVAQLGEGPLKELGWQPKAPRIRSDLDTLRLGEIAATLPVPVVCAQDEALGALYVVEGSMLGGQIVARQLRESDPEGLGRALAFHGGYEAQGPGHWQRVGAFLVQAAGPGPLGERRVVAAARASFKALEAWVDTCPPSGPTGLGSG